VSPEKEAELLANVKSFTDHMTYVDAVFKAARLGKDMVLTFQCGESGLYFEGDYLRNWGRRYGIGLGPSPVSETLQSDYDVDPPEISPLMRAVTEVMHPLRVSGSQVDALLVAKKDFEGACAVVAKDDPYLKARLPILWAKQMKNGNSRLKQMVVAFEQAGKVVM